ncbi:alpha/beta hydrolase [Roseobacter sp. HKCCA0434]|uniref:alpha/beta fold hydrolase n=1 Tax=Roseobacter sp. HKCCA0434 TaxID=3079297 RepID=UPI002905E0BD|nr:alpha/beta hydrolase [Roseobacter sp. HKCCA0434]
MKRFTTSDGLSLAYDDQGEGVPVLCLPGLTRNMEDFTPLAGNLPRPCRLIRLDLRGRGASDHDPDPVANYTVPVESRDVIELLDHLGLDEVVIVGTSRGGIIAMVLAAMAKERLAGVLLNDIGPEIDAKGLGNIMTYLGRTPAAKTLDQAARGLARFYGPSFAGVDEAAWRVWAARWYEERPDGLHLRYDPALRDAVEAGGAAPDLWPFFEALDGVPLAALRGANSDLLSAETFEKMKGARPDMIAATVPGRGHVPFLDEEESLDVFARLLDAVTA